MPPRKKSRRGTGATAALVAAAALAAALAGAAPARADEELDALLARIATASTFERHRIIERIGVIGTPDAVGALIGFFRDDELRWMAARQATLFGSKALRPLMRALTSSYPETVRTAAWALGEIHDPAAVPALIPLLRREDPEVRQNAAFALGMIRDTAASEALIGALRDEDPVVRGYAATALGEIGDRRAKDALLEALRAEDASVVNMASSLFALGSTEVVAILLEKLRDPDPNKRLYAAYALGKIRDPAMVTPLVEILGEEDIGWLAAKALANVGAPAVQPLLAALFSDKRTVRLYAAYALGEIADPRAGRGLLRMLEDPDPLVRQTAVEALAAIDDPGLIPAVSRLLPSPDPAIRRAALDTLGHLGDQALVPTIGAFLADPDPGVVKSAILALGNLQTGATCALLARLLDQQRTDIQDAVRSAFLATGGEAAVTCLMGVVENSRGTALSQAVYLLGKLRATEAVDQLITLLRDPDPMTRRFAAAALTEIGDARAEEPFVALLGDPDPAVRTYASVGLMAIGGRIAIKLLLASLANPDTQWLAVRILDKIAERDVDSLIAALRSENTRWYAQGKLASLDGAVLPQLEERLAGGEDPLVRESVAQILGEVRDRRAVEPLLDAIRAEDSVSLTSASAIVQIGDTAAVPPLIEMLSGHGEQVRLYAAYALGGLRDRRAVAPLLAALADPSSSVRGIVAHALGEIGSREALDGLVAALEDASPHVRATSAYALARIGDRRAEDRLEEKQQSDPDSAVRRAATDALAAIRTSGR